MKMYLISDNIDTQIGLRLAGIDGIVAHERGEIEAAMNRAFEDKELGILIFTEKAADEVKSEIAAARMTRHTPLIIEIPDRHGSRDIAGSINQMVEESIGLKL